MGLNCGAKCAKYVLFIFNIIFFLGGAAVLGVGIWIKVNTASFSDVFDKVVPAAESSKYLDGNILTANMHTINVVSYMMMSIGGFVFLVAFLGCCGAVKEWRPMLVTYAMCLMIVMGVEVGAGIAAGVYWKDIEDTVRSELTKIIDKYDYVPTTLEGNHVDVTKNATDSSATAGSIAVTATWNTLQVWIGCCGVDNYTALTTNTPYGSKIGSIPPVFCCKYKDPATLELQDSKCFNDIGRFDTAVSNHQMGCVKKVATLLDDNAPAVIGVAVGIGLIELIGVVFSFCLCCAIGDKLKRKRETKTVVVQQVQRRV